MLLKKLGVPNSSAHKAIRAMGKIYPPKSLKRGQKVVVFFQPNSWWETNRHFAGFNFSPTSFQIISVSRKINGTFEKGDHILVKDLNNIEFARGLTSFSSIEIEKIKGSHSSEIKNILGYSSREEIIHKDDLVKV